MANFGKNKKEKDPWRFFTAIPAKSRSRRKRVKPILQRKIVSSGNAYRPESIISRARKNSHVLNQIRHRGVQGLWPRRRSSPVFGSGISAKPKKPFCPAFSMPLVPVICFVLLGAIFAIDNRASISAMMNRDVISPRTDAGGEISMAAFVSGTIAQQPAAAGAAVDPAAVIHEEIKNEPIPLKMVEYFAWEKYTVKRGDSVSSIAADFGISMDAVIASNNLPNAHLLTIGQVLRIPNMNGIPYVIKKGDTLYKISQSYNIPLDVLVDVNNIQQDLIIPGQNIFLPGARMPVNDLRLAIGTYFISPLRGMGARLTSSFGWRDDPFGGGRRYHEAVDMAISAGTPVRAASGGKVAVVGNSPVYGKYIIISHNAEFQTLYAHLSAFSVKQGDTVEQGGKIGEVGSTGLSTGPHLHFAVYKNGRAVNPLDYFAL